MQEGRTAPSNFPPRPFSGKQIALDHKLLQIDIDSEQISIQTSFNDNLPRKLRHPSFLKTMETSSGSGRKGWQFILNEFRDEGINVSGNVPMKSIELICDGQLDIHSTDSFLFYSLSPHLKGLYVALTRARVTLSIPKSIKTLLQDLDRIHYLVETFKKDAAGVDGRGMPSSNDESMIVVGTKGRKLTKVSCCLLLLL